MVTMLQLLCFSQLAFFSLTLGHEVIFMAIPFLLLIKVALLEHIYAIYFNFYTRKKEHFSYFLVRFSLWVLIRAA